MIIGLPEHIQIRNAKPVVKIDKASIHSLISFGA